jgi:CheY-like chemotaxis protein
MLNSSNRAGPRTADLSPLGADPTTLLIAEDNLVNQKITLRMVQKLGYRADIANNGLEALEALTRGNYSLILMDCQMPTMCGLEATREIRKRHPDRKLPIIAVTANTLPGDRERCLEAGMDDYVSKPVNQELLRDAIERWLGPGE